MTKNKIQLFLDLFFNTCSKLTIGEDVWNRANVQSKPNASNKVGTPNNGQLIFDKMGQIGEFENSLICHFYKVTPNKQNLRSQLEETSG